MIVWKILIQAWLHREWGEGRMGQVPVPLERNGIEKGSGSGGCDTSTHVCWKLYISMYNIYPPGLLSASVYPEWFGCGRWLYVLCHYWRTNPSVAYIQHCNPAQPMPHHNSLWYLQLYFIQGPLNYSLLPGQDTLLASTSWAWNPQKHLLTLQIKQHIWLVILEHLCNKLDVHVVDVDFLSNF